MRCKSSHQVFAEPKDRSSPEASKKDKGVIARWGLKEVPCSKSGIFDNPKVRGDLQEPDLRCGTPGTSGHVTTKSSIRNWDVLYKSGVYALKVMCLTLGGLYSVLY